MGVSVGTLCSVMRRTERLLLGYKEGWNTGKGCGTHKRTYKASCSFEFKFCHGLFIFVADKCLIMKLKIDGVRSKSKVKSTDFTMSILNVQKWIKLHRLWVWTVLSDWSYNPDCIMLFYI